MEDAAVRVSSRGALSLVHCGSRKDHLIFGGAWGVAADGAGEGRLFTATLELDRGESIVRMFHACHAANMDEVLTSLAARIPSSYLAQVEIRAGIEADHPVVQHLVPAAALASLIAIGDCCPRNRPLSIGGVLNIKERMG